MIKSWQECKNVLVVRADNMGDLIMSAPAIRALKETFSCKITVLTSTMATGIVPFIPEIDDMIVFDFPWVKSNSVANNEAIFSLVKILKERQFDASVIFTVFSQNPLPAAMVAYMAGIPLRLAYCRENPYELLTDWVADKEPYTLINHQVERDLLLVNSIGAKTTNNTLHLKVAQDPGKTVTDKLNAAGVITAKPWVIFHAGVSEKKREYPNELWAQAAKKLMAVKGFQILYTGSAAEKATSEQLALQSGKGSFAVAGLFTLAEFIQLIKIAPVVVSVNTGTVHIAAAVNTPIVVLYAQTNPQHTPWKVKHKVLEFGVEEKNRSKNEVIQFLYKTVFKKPSAMPDSNDIFNAVIELLPSTS